MGDHCGEFISRELSQKTFCDTNHGFSLPILQRKSVASWGSQYHRLNCLKSCRHSDLFNQVNQLTVVLILRIGVFGPDGFQQTVQ